MSISLNQDSLFSSIGRQHWAICSIPEKPRVWHSVIARCAIGAPYIGLCGRIGGKSPQSTL